MTIDWSLLPVAFAGGALGAATVDGLYATVAVTAGAVARTVHPTPDGDTP